MNAILSYLPLAVFVALALLIVLGAARFFRASLEEISGAAKEHAKLYAVAYVKGGALVALAMLASFDEAFRTLTRETAAGLSWWGWALLFFKPISAGLAVLVAFLDRSAGRATDNNIPKVTP